MEHPEEVAPWWDPLKDATEGKEPMHDDDNGVISLSCWTSMTEADTLTELVFLINGHEVVLGVSALRWVLFMGYIPHETRPADPTQPASIKLNLQFHPVH